MKIYRDPSEPDPILLGCAVLKALGPEPKTLRQIADACGVTHSAIMQIENKALTKLRHPERIKQLKEYKV